MHSKRKIIFLNSYSPRTGHNFVSEVIKIFSDHVVLAHNRSETKISTFINESQNILRKIYFESDKEFHQYLFFGGLREKILTKSESNYVLIKDVSFVGTSHLRKLFPEDIHILLLRDPKNVFSSVFKVMSFNDKSFKTTIKKLGLSFGLYSYYFSQKISNKVIRNFPDLDGFFVLRYEDLVMKDEKTLQHLKALFQTSKSLTQIKKEIDAIPVINSSFFEEVGAEKVWDQKKKNSSFNPLKRRHRNYLMQKGIELGSKSLRKKMGYI